MVSRDRLSKMRTVLRDLGLSLLLRGRTGPRPFSLRFRTLENGSPPQDLSVSSRPGVRGAPRINFPPTSSTVVSGGQKGVLRSKATRDETEGCRSWTQETGLRKETDNPTMVQTSLTLSRGNPHRIFTGCPRSPLYGVERPGS